MRDTKKIVVTGAGGFIGEALLEELAPDESIEVTALTRRDTAGRPAGERCRWETTDYSSEDLKRILTGADAVVHLAGTRGDKTKPEDFAGDGIMLDNLLESMAACGVGRLVLSSSRLVYGNTENLPWREDTPPEPKSEYGKCRLRCETKSISFAEEHGIRLTVLRIAQVLGYGDRIRNMMSVFLESAAGGRELRVIGRSRNARQYIYVRDLARLIHEIISTDREYPLIINTGMEKAYTNLEIAGLVNEAFGNTVPVKYEDDTEETTDPSCMDVSVLIKETGLRPADMAEALKEMADQKR